MSMIVIVTRVFTKKKITTRDGWNEVMCGTKSFGNQVFFNCLLINRAIGLYDDLAEYFSANCYKLNQRTACYKWKSWRASFRKRVLMSFISYCYQYVAEFNSRQNIPAYRYAEEQNENSWSGKYWKLNLQLRFTLRIQYKRTITKSLSKLLIIHIFRANRSSNRLFTIGISTLDQLLKWRVRSCFPAVGADCY